MAVKPFLLFTSSFMLKNCWIPIHYTSVRQRHCVDSLIENDKQISPFAHTVSRDKYKNKYCITLVKEMDWLIRWIDKGKDFILFEASTEVRARTHEMRSLRKREREELESIGKFRCPAPFWAHNLVRIIMFHWYLECLKLSWKLLHRTICICHQSISQLPSMNYSRSLYQLTSTTKHWMDFRIQYQVTLEL